MHYFSAKQNTETWNKPSPVQNTDTSNVCNRWLQCGGKVTIWTPFSTAKSMASTDKCEQWLSIRRITGEASDGFPKAMKWRINWTNSGWHIQPESFAYPAVPDETLSKKLLCIFFLGKRKNGGMLLPAAITVNAIVIIVPLSAASIFPTRRIPFKAITLPIFDGTVEKPLSSMLKIWVAPKSCLEDKTELKFSKNRSTLDLQNAFARFIEVCSGVRNTSWWWRFMNLWYQCRGAIFSSSQPSGQPPIFLASWYANLRSSVMLSP